MSTTWIVPSSKEQFGETGQFGDRREMIRAGDYLPVFFFLFLRRSRILLKSSRVLRQTSFPYSIRSVQKIRPCRMRSPLYTYLP